MGLNKNTNKYFFKAPLRGLKRFEGILMRILKGSLDSHFVIESFGVSISFGVLWPLKQGSCRSFWSSSNGSVSPWGAELGSGNAVWGFLLVFCNVSTVYLYVDRLCQFLVWCHSVSGRVLASTVICWCCVFFVPGWCLVLSVFLVLQVWEEACRWSTSRAFGLQVAWTAVRVVRIIWGFNGAFLTECAGQFMLMCGFKHWQRFRARSL